MLVRHRINSKQSGTFVVVDTYSLSLLWSLREVSPRETSDLLNVNRFVFLSFRGFF